MTEFNPSTVSPALGKHEIKASLHRAERRNRLYSLALVSPLLVFVLVLFLAPILLMLYSAIDNPEVGKYLPRTSVALQAWDGAALPDEDVYAAFAEDVAVAHKELTLGIVARRISYEVANARSRFLEAGRMTAADASGPWKEKLLAVDPMWADTEFWAVVKRASAPLTPYYLLTAVDLRQDAGGAVQEALPDRSIFRTVIMRTLGIAFVVTVLALAIGYPVAGLLANLPDRYANLLMILVLLPFMTSLLVRTIAWVLLLQTNGLINDMLLALNITSERVQLIYTRLGTVVAMTQLQLPFTILPLYSVMKSIPPNLTRAARSLGAGPVRAFVSVYLPQTMPGIGAGCLLTFIMSLGYYITPALIGGPQDQMLSQFIAIYIDQELNWGQAAALGAILLVLTLLFYAVFNRLVGIDKIRVGS